LTRSAQALEVEVDTHRGLVRVRRVISVHDVGRAINRQQVEGQIEGCVAQAVGYALTENFLVREGKILTPHFSTYLLPTTLDAPTEIYPERFSSRRTSAAPCCAARPRDKVDGEERTMQTIPDLAIPEVKPALELYRGVLRQKMSPQWTHSRLQSALVMMLTAWAKERGRVGTEWRFYFIEGDGVPSSSLVPDVAYLSFDRLPRHPREAAERPTIAPDIAIEVLSPDDRDRDVAEKIALYLAYGTPRVVVVDPQSQSITIHEQNGTSRTMTGTGSISVTDDLDLDLEALFSPEF